MVLFVRMGRGVLFCSKTVPFIVHLRVTTYPKNSLPFQ